MTTWLLRIVWATLPVTAGPVAAEALQDWSSAPRATASALCWIVWAIALVATFAPRPIGLTTLRAVAPTFLVLGIVHLAAGDADLTTVGGVAALLLAAVLVAHPGTAIAAVNGVAYGDERRYPLRTPPTLSLSLVPLARAVLAAGVTMGPILLADGDVVASAFALALGVPLAAFAARSLHTLSRRWIVLVPAGLVIVDPMTLVDPVLFTREHVRSLRSIPPRSTPPDALDLRLGATAGSLDLVLDDEVDLLRTTPGRRGGTNARTSRITVAAVKAQDLLETASHRRLRVEVR